MRKFAVTYKGKVYFTSTSRGEAIGMALTILRKKYKHDFHYPRYYSRSKEKNIQWIEDDINLLANPAHSINYVHVAEIAC